MAKSIRSKWKRKCRAVKRERYGKKELDRLKKTLGIDDTEDVKKDVDMAPVAEVANVVDAKTLSKNTAVDETEMDTDANKRDFNTKTLRNANGAYPIWVHPRKIMKKKKGRKGKKKGKKQTS